jgi:hypothetical protein
VVGSALAAGFASSGLRVVESSHKPWVNDRVWLSLNKILAQNARKRLDVGRNKKTYDTLDFANKVRSRFLLWCCTSSSLLSTIRSNPELVDQAHLLEPGLPQ